MLRTVLSAISDRMTARVECRSACRSCWSRSRSIRPRAWVGSRSTCCSPSRSSSVSHDEAGITFRYKDYRRDERHRTMTLRTDEFIRRFLLHVLPKGFHRIRHYGLLASRPQGRSRQGQGPARRARAKRDGGAHRTARPSTAVPMLRRPHDDHRDLRAREASASAAGYRHADPDGDVVTRHGPHLPHVLAQWPRRSLPRVFLRLIARLYLKILTDRMRSNLQLPPNDRSAGPSTRFHAAASDTRRACPRVPGHQPFLKTP